MSEVERFLALLKEARELLRDPLVQQVLSVLQQHEPLSAPELGLEEIALVDVGCVREQTPDMRTGEDWDAEDDGEEGQASSPSPSHGFHGSPPSVATSSPPFPKRPRTEDSWDPVLHAERRLLACVQRHEPMDAAHLFEHIRVFMAASRHIPDRLPSFCAWIDARPRVFHRTSSGVIYPVEGAERFLAIKRDILEFAASQNGYRVTPEAIRNAVPELGQDVSSFVLCVCRAVEICLSSQNSCTTQAWAFCTTFLTEELAETGGLLELRPFYSSNEWRTDMNPPLFRVCKYREMCRFGRKCSHSHTPWRRCYKLW